MREVEDADDEGERERERVRKVQGREWAGVGGKTRGKGGKFIKGCRAGVTCRCLSYTIIRCYEIIVEREPC